VYGTAVPEVPETAASNINQSINQPNNQSINLSVAGFISKIESKPTPLRKSTEE